MTPLFFNKGFEVENPTNYFANKVLVDFQPRIQPLATLRGMALIGDIALIQWAKATLLKESSEVSL